MSSTRLPGKVLRQVLGRPLLEYQLERLGLVGTPHRLVVATTRSAADDAIVDVCNALGVQTYRGPEDDVLARYGGAVALFGAVTVVRVTGDCPLIDPPTVDRVLERYRRGGCDYVSNTLDRTFPRGLDVEVFSREALDDAVAEATEPFEREHVTPFICRRPDRYRLCNVAHPEDLSHHRWTVDTQEDFELIARILTALYPVDPAFGMIDVLELLSAHPEWAEPNAHVRPREVVGQ